jgi:bifunctional non-homologous end joining protein LigD
MIMYARPVLYLNGDDLRKLPLTERKALLKKLIADTDVQFSESFEVDGREMYAHACKTGLQPYTKRIAHRGIWVEPWPAGRKRPSNKC